MAGITVDKETSFTAEEWDSCEYSVKSKRVLVVYFCQDNPIGTKDNAKTLICVDTEASKLNDEKVDIDVEHLDKFYRDRFSQEVYIDGQEKKQLKVKLCKNCTYEELNEEMQKLGQNAYKFDVFFFHFFTYLQVGEIGGSGNRHLDDCRLQFYDKAIPLDQIVDKIKYLPALALKPKVFIIQADDLEMLQPRKIKKAAPFPTTTTKKIPSDADILIIMSTIPQALASKPNKQLTACNKPVGQPSSGDNAVPKCSMLVQAIVDVLADQRWKDQELFSNTPLIHGRVQEIIRNTNFGENYEGFSIPIPTTQSTLTKLLYFNHWSR